MRFRMVPRENRQDKSPAPFGAGLFRFLDCRHGTVDGSRNRRAESASGDGDAGTDDGQNQRIFGRGSARLVANERLDRIDHVKSQCDV